jgi:rSAM/selenodomain-associated transferase 1
MIPFHSPRSVVIVMTKIPKLGQVKTRLHPLLGQELSTSFHELCVFDIINHIKNFFDVFLCLSGSKEDSWLNHQSLDNIHCFFQVSGSLGERMNAALEYGFERGYSEVILLGSDAPHLHASSLQNWVDYVNSTSTSLVLLPSWDGGYVSLIATRPLRALGAPSIRWSTDHTLGDTVKELSAAGHSIQRGEYSYDIDEPQDLLFLYRQSLAFPELTKHYPRVFEWMISHQDLILQAEKQP